MAREKCFYTGFLPYITRWCLVAVQSVNFLFIFYIDLFTCEFENEVD